MADRGRVPASSPATGSGPLALRLTLVFVAVALAAVALLAGLTAVFAEADVSHLAGRQDSELADAVAVAAGVAWDHDHGWAGARLGPVLELAARAGADVEIRDTAGRVVASSPGFGAGAGAKVVRAPVVVQGQRVGLVAARFTAAGLGGADRALQAALINAIAGAAGAAALLALVTGLVVARRITRPVERLIAVARAMSGGDRTARAGDVRAPGELRDLTAAFDQMADTLVRQEQLRRELVADVAHELRTPIAVLQAGHEALLDGVAEPTPAQLASMRDEVLRLARRVDDLQALAGAEAAALRLSRARCDLAQVAAGAADNLSHRFEAAGITVDRQLAVADVLADEGRLHQVVTNLLTNALKFTPHGGQVTIATSRAGGDAVLQVSDTGPGIPPDELPHVFDRFWRGRNAARTSGSGIGLAVAAELTRAHSGRLTAASPPGHGTQMTLTLPAA
jgi:two-component system sensor histidine kinase BaeS